ncbi:MAG: cation transporter [Clostridia bacterium]|nr:cation transporter [Clostridia bacterium]
MKKTFRFEGLECPNCAKKLEAALTAMEGVTTAGVNFLTKKLTIEADDDRFDEILAAAVAAGKSIKEAFALRD